MRDPLLLIDGRLVPGASTMPVVNPATGKEFARAPAASELQLNEAVEAAARAFPAWSATPFDARKAKVLQMADAIEAHSETLAQILTQEHGKLLAGARAEVNSTIQYFRYFATLSLAAEQVEDSAVRRVEVHRVPLGVVATIIPWNFPLLLLAFKLPPALLAGNTVVVKSAPSTPLATLKLAEILSEMLPAGVLNVLTGTDALGPLLTAHPGIRKVSFTGSTETGKRVMAAGAATLMRLTLELGGNDAAIVLDDVDVDKTAELIFASAFGTSGQVCRAVKRVYVHPSLYDPFCEKLAAIAQRSVVGDNDTPGAEFGPVQNRATYDRLVKLLADSEGCGSVMPGGGLLEREGFFIRPTIVKDIGPQSRLVVEEQFGPILPVLRFDGIDDVVAQANEGPFGLSASVWSKDLEQARSIADRLNVGTVFINKHIDRVPHVPMAGAKQSGIGVELGTHGLNEFTQIKVFNISDPA